MSLMEQLDKLAEKLYAPGLPSKETKKPIPTVTKPKEWDFVDSKHRAERAGPHTDLRLSDGRTAYSWAVRKGLPEPGRSHLAIRQPDHLPSYLPFEGRIESEYGRGDVRPSRLGKARVPNASPRKIHFAALDRKNPDQFVLVRTPKYGPDKWLLMNQTPTTKSRPDVPTTKPPFKEDSVESMDKYLSDRHILSSKIDGAQVTVGFDGKVEVFSHRPSVSGELINHTFVLGAEDVKPPPSLKKTRVRAELFGVKGKKPIPMRTLGGLMNSSPQKALDQMKRQGIKLYAAPFQVVEHEGKSMEFAPYDEQLKVLNKVVTKMPDNWVMPDIAKTPREKTKLVDLIRKKRHPLTEEGLVAWPAGQVAAQPTKLKFREHSQVYVVDVFPMKSRGKTLNLAGGFTYSLKPGGPEVGRVGTGFSLNLRKELWKDRKDMKGKKVVIASLGQFPNGAYRAPSFISFHL
ncbi:MAG: hypothetical protein JSW03_08715 [Candidatus Eiseniibacteriota bacterium]|nr:MAG: hypothetical protein JSW03_08715 [Candidatus Eisenbacteria bacterium]